MEPDRRDAMRSLAAPALAGLLGSSAPELAESWRPPRISVAGLEARLTSGRFNMHRLYGYELEFQATVEVSRAVPLLKIGGASRDAWGRVHLYRHWGDLPKGKVFNIVGLIVSFDYGAWSVWAKKVDYAE